MILEDATKEAYGYYSTDWKPKSHKNIIAACDKCGKIRILRKDSYRSFCNLCSVRLSEAQKGEKGNMFGKRHSEETLKKMSKAQRGRKHSEETKRKISKAGKGLKRSEETCIRIREAHKGITPTEEAKRKMGESRKGANNPNWRDGISFEPYCTKFNAEYKTMIRNRFSNECFICGKTAEENGQALDVHHVNYNKNCGCDGEKCICVPLCHPCHMKSNYTRDYWQALIMKKLKETVAGWL